MKKLLFFLALLPAMAAPLYAGSAETLADSTTSDPKIVAAAVLNAFRKNDFTILEKFVPAKEDIRETMKEREAALKEDADKIKYEAFLTTMATMISKDVKESFDKVAAEAKTAGLNWADGNFTVATEAVEGMKYPGHKITITFKTAKGDYQLLVKADKMARGLVVGNKLKLEAPAEK